MRYRYLSHVLGDEVPVFGGRSTLCREMSRSITRGDTTNAHLFTVGSHYGTHIDAPNHFFDDGRKAAAYPADFWIFRKPAVVDLRLEPSELLRSGNWTDGISVDADIVLLRSGWFTYRGEDRYSLENPGIHPDVARHLRAVLPGLRAVGIDWISVSAYRDRETGRETHRAFLGANGPGKPVCLIEDMDLSGDLGGLCEIIALPLRVQDIDSAPCTVVGGIRD